MSHRIFELYEQIAEQIDIETGSRLSEALHDFRIVLEQRTDAAELAAEVAKQRDSEIERLHFADAAVKAEERQQEAERQVDTIIKNIHKAAVHLIYKARR